MAMQSRNTSNNRSGPPSSNGSNSPRSNHRGLPGHQNGSVSPHHHHHHPNHGSGPPKPAQIQRLHAQVNPSIPSSSSNTSSVNGALAPSGLTPPLTYTTPTNSVSSLSQLPPPASPSATSSLLYSPPAPPLLGVPTENAPYINGNGPSSTFSSPRGRGRAASPKSSFGAQGSGLNYTRPSFNLQNQPPSAGSQHQTFAVPYPPRVTASPRATSPDGSVTSSAVQSSRHAMSSSSISQAFRSIASSSSLAPSVTIGSGYTSNMSSRVSSRRPSMVTLQSFLEGVNHVTRVRSPSLRGHSRAGSLDGSQTSSVAGGAGSGFFSRKDSMIMGDRPWHEDDIEEVPSWEEHSKYLTPSSPTPRQNDSLFGPARSIQPLRRDGYLGAAPVVASPTDLFTPEHEFEPSTFRGASPRPIGPSRAVDFAILSPEDEYDEYAERTFVDRRDMALFPHHGRDSSDHVKQEDEAAHLANLEEDSLWTESDLNTLQEGDRLGIGLELEGYPIVDALEAGADSPFRIPDDDGIQYEVIRQLGYGSYAIVYLVKEVLYDRSEDEAPFPNDDAASYTSRRSEGIIYGREFALKCLSKRNLSEDQIAVQKLEATLHKQLPRHDNVVALHKAFETPVWLFLVLEYCPGQDMFFWLEQARDTEGIAGDPSRAPSRLSSRAPMPASVVSRAMHHNHSATPSPPLGQSPHDVPFFNEKEHTPPSPSLLSATLDVALLSRRRLRLISRMFGQMCEALQACHDAGVSHRDIKPENIIIVDNRAELGSLDKVVIKITDWGLGTTDERCEDFDCGSKPYMAYECRNNTMPSYEPKGADVWSLGIVLLNLLFHRCPWADPTLDDPDYSAFNHNPIHFLETRFQGIGNEVATFLATKVFCEVEDSLSSGLATPGLGAKRTGTRVTAGEFGKWAKQLVRYMGEGSRRASISESTVPLVQAMRQSPRLDDKRVFYSPQAKSPRHSLQLSGKDGELEASPSRFKSFGLPNDLVEEISKAEQNGKHDIQVFSLHHIDHIPQPGTGLEEALEVLQVQAEGTQPEPPIVVSETEQQETEEQAEKEVPEGEDAEADKERKERHRRRKRGARKTKSKPEEGAEEGGAASPTASQSRSPVRSRSGTLSSPSPEINITEATLSIQALAREMSKAKPPLTSSQSYAPEPAKPTKSRFSDRFKGAFANGNQDLQAFQQRARERDMALTGGKDYNNPTASAPAKMQHENSFGPGVGSGISSFGSVASTGSWSEDGGVSSHWASTGSRRERQKQHGPGGSMSRDRGAEASGSRPSRRGPGQQHRSSSHHHHASPSTAASSPSRASYSPISSFSSTTSYGAGTGPGVAARSPLQSIEEKVTKESPPTTAATVKPPPFIITHSEPLLAQAIREPLPPPLDIPPPVAPLQPAAVTAKPEIPAVNQQQQQPPPAGKAKFGRLFKFSRS